LLFAEGAGFAGELVMKIVPDQCKKDGEYKLQIIFIFILVYMDNLNY